MTNANENPRGLPVALTLLAEVLPPKPLGDVSGYSFAMSATNSAELHNRFARVATDYAALQAEAEALRADAARWKFWRDAAIDEDGSKRAAILAQPFPATKEQLDTAIDAALAAEGRE